MSMIDYILQRCERLQYEELQRKYKLYDRMTPKTIARFWGNVEKTEECWLWRGHMVGFYGQFHVDRKIVSAHRFAYMLEYGFIPKGMRVLRSCKIPFCVNPQHLYLGTVEAANNQRIRDYELKAIHRRKIIQLRYGRSVN